MPNKRDDNKALTDTLVETYCRSMPSSFHLEEKVCTTDGLVPEGQHPYTVLSACPRPRPFKRTFGRMYQPWTSHQSVHKRPAGTLN
jgi:hypothetical protein